MTKQESDLLEALRSRWATQAEAFERAVEHVPDDAPSCWRACANLLRGCTRELGWEMAKIHKEG